MSTQTSQRFGFALFLALALFACGKEPPKPGPGGAGAGAGTSAGTGASGQGGVSGAGGGSTAGTGSSGSSGGTISIAGSGGEAGHVGDAGVPSDGCLVEGKHYADGATGIPAADGCNICSCNDGQLGCTKIACPDTSECVVARRLDQCCNVWGAYSHAEVVSDECLVAYPALGVEPDLVSKCEKKGGVSCELVDCALFEPLSRVAAKNAGGICAYADECQNADDCVLAADRSACCACPESMPASILGGSSCLRKDGDTGQVPESCVCKLLVKCAQCEAPKEPTCTVRNSYSICQ